MFEALLNSKANHIHIFEYRDIHMNERISFVKHSGKEILYCDFSTLMTTKIIELLDKCYELIKTKEDLLLLFDVTNASIFGEAFEHAKDFAKRIQPYRKKSALIGVSGPKQMLLKSILLFSGSAKKVQAFSTKEEALDWLVK